MSDFTMLNRIERVPELNRCSAKAIAVWSMLHHALDRRGRVALGGVDYKTVLVRRLAVETSDRQWFYATLRELEVAGLFVVEGDTFQLIGHAGAGSEDVPKKPRGRRPAADLPPTSVGPSADLHPTSSLPTSDLPPTSSGPSADLLSGSTQNDSTRDLQRREEKIREDKRREGSSVEPPSAPSPAVPEPIPQVDPRAEIRALEARYPPGLCAEARAAVALSRRNGKVADSVWLKALRQLDAHPVATSTHALRVFVERHADGDKGEAYLVAIARREAKGTSTRNARGPARPATHAEFQAAFDPQYDDPDLIDWGNRREAANA